MNPRGSWATAVLILSLLGAFGAAADLCSADELPVDTLLLPYGSSPSPAAEATPS